VQGNQAAPEAPPPTRTVLFLGAGASSAAKVPMTFDMLRLFRESLQDGTSDKDLLTAILDHLSHREHSDGGPSHRVDVETVLESINMLEDASGIGAAFFARDLQTALRNPEALGSLRSTLQNFIRGKCLVLPEALTKLRDFRRFFDTHDYVDIFTLNYDVVVELLCELENIPYSDGFELRWDESNFDNPRKRARIYKLHGSAIWFQSPRAGYIKVPLRFTADRVEHLSGERAAPLMMYPAQKWDNSQVLLALHTRLGSALRSVDWAIIIGYSLRDSEVNNVIYEAARDRRQLRLVIVSPSAESLYRTKLLALGGQGGGTGQFRPVLEDRVVRLPFAYECILPDLTTGLFSRIQQTDDWYRMVRRQFADGFYSGTNMETLIVQLLECGRLEESDIIAGGARVPVPNEDWFLRYRCWRAAVLYSLRLETQATEAWFLVHATLHDWFGPKLGIQWNGSDDQPVFVHYHRNLDNPADVAQGSTVAAGLLPECGQPFERHARYTSIEDPPDDRHAWHVERRELFSRLAAYFNEIGNHPPTLAQLLGTRKAEFGAEVGAIEELLIEIPPTARSARIAEFTDAISNLERKHVAALLHLPAQTPPPSAPSIAP
jgi:SIR2-like protein